MRFLVKKENGRKYGSQIKDSEVNEKLGGLPVLVYQKNFKSSCGESGVHDEIPSSIAYGTLDRKEDGEFYVELKGIGFIIPSLMHAIEKDGKITHLVMETRGELIRPPEKIAMSVH